MRKKLFGNNISASCSYCSFSTEQGETLVCTKESKPDEINCKSFKYDPLKRKPRVKPILPEYDPEEFTL